MKKQPQMTEQTKKNIMNSYWKLYKNKDITKITVKNICDDANYDRTTFYRYFTNISDVLRQFEDEIIYNIKTSINNNTNNNKINILFDGFNKFDNNYGEYIYYFYKNNNHNFSNKFKKLVKKDVYNYFNFNINDSNKEEFLFEFMFSSLINSYVYWYEHKNIMSLESFVAFANNIISNGINAVLK